MSTEKLRWLPPEAGRWETATWHMWQTKCQRYRVMRLVSTLDDRQRFACEYSKTVEQHGGGTHTFWDYLPCARVLDERRKSVAGNYAKEFRLLHTALEAIEKFHRQSVDAKGVESNRDDIVAQAEKLGLASVGPSADYNNATGDLDMPTATAEKNRVSFDRKAIIEMLESIGVVQARKLDPKTLAARLKNVAKYPAEERIPPTAAGQRLMDQVLAAVEDGSRIEFTGFDEGKKPDKKEKDKPHESNGSAKAAKNKKAPKGEKSPKQGSAGGNAEKDKYGYRVTSNPSRALAVLTKTPKTMKEIMKEIGRPDSEVHGDFGQLVKQGVIGRSKEGFFLLK